MIKGPDGSFIARTTCGLNKVVVAAFRTTMTVSEGRTEVNFLPNLFGRKKPEPEPEQPDIIEALFYSLLWPAERPPEQGECADSNALSDRRRKLISFRGETIARRVDHWQRRSVF